MVRQRITTYSCEQLTPADAGLEDEVRELIRRAKIRSGESWPLNACVNACGQLIDGIDAYDRVIRSPFCWQLEHTRRLRHKLGAIVRNQPQAVWVPRTGQHKAVQQGFQAPIRVIPVQAACAVPLYLQRASGNRCRGHLAPNRRQDTGAPGIAQFPVGMEMHSFDSIVGRCGCRQVEFVDEFA